MKENKYGIPRGVKQALSVEERLDILHLSEHHHLRYMDIGDILNLKYSTVNQILKNYQASGRVNKLLTLSAKQLILKRRLKTNQTIRANGRDRIDKNMINNLCLDLEIED